MTKKKEVIVPKIRLNVNMREWIVRAYIKEKCSAKIDKKQKLVEEWGREAVLEQVPEKFSKLIIHNDVDVKWFERASYFHILDSGINHSYVEFDLEMCVPYQFEFKAIVSKTYKKFKDHCIELQNMKKVRNELQGNIASRIKHIRTTSELLEAFPDAKQIIIDCIPECAPVSRALVVNMQDLTDVANNFPAPPSSAANPKGAGQAIRAAKAAARS